MGEANREAEAPATVDAVEEEGPHAPHLRLSPSTAARAFFMRCPLRCLSAIALALPLPQGFATGEEI